LRVVGQIGAAYIIAEGPAGMYLIDQYAAHQRILFEQLMAQYHAGQISTQRTLTDTILDLSPSQTRLLKKYIGTLESLGFEIEPFGSHTFRLRSIPAVLSNIEPSEVLHRMLRDLDEQPANVQADIEKLIPRLCQSAAIKAGQILEHGDMQKLLHQLERCQNPHTTPAGQPTMIHMSTAQLEQQFGRT
jgi:DNA mismatch repair protein MutL